MHTAPRYFSTNQAIFGTPDLERRLQDGSLPTVGLAEAIITGQAPDGGLFMPTHFPQLPIEQIMGMRDKTYPEVFVEVMEGYFQGVLSRNTLERISREAYTFAPLLEPITEKDVIARLDEGPSAAFKDFAAQVFFRIVSALIEEEPATEIAFRTSLREKQLLTYLVSTSGDTGGAMGVAAHGIPRVHMIILHSDSPRHVRELQAKQMDTLGGNVDVIRVINATFDDCAALDTLLQRDPELKHLNLSSGNSKNIGRLLPQMAYYFFTYSRIARGGEEVYFSVPSGNFGDAVAGLFARASGLPMRLIIGVNENDVFKKLHATGEWKPASKAAASPSNSMNVRDPSNVRRMVQLFGGQLIGGSMAVSPDMAALRDAMAAYRISDRETLRTILDFYHFNHQIAGLHSTIEPHGAVAWAAAQRFRKDTGYDGTIIVFETAHPGKFPESLQRMGIEPELPPCLKRLVNVPHGRYSVVPNNYNALREEVLRLHERALAAARS